MADYTVWSTNGVRIAGPATPAFNRPMDTFGLEFYVTKTVWLKYAHLWRNSSQHTGTPTFQLYRITSKTTGVPVTGGAGTMPTGNYGGWCSSRCNPIRLDPGVRYKMAVSTPNYYHETADMFGPGQSGANGFADPTGTLVIPGSAGAQGGDQQMTYNIGSSYPTTTYNHYFWWVDVTVTDVNPAAVLTLGSKSTKGKSGSAGFTLGTFGVKGKRAIKTSTIGFHLAASGYSRAFARAKASVNLSFDSFASNVNHAATQSFGRCYVFLGNSGISRKISPKSDSTRLILQTLQPSEFFRNVADSVRSAMIAQHWSEADGRFRESAATDAERLSATVMGGLFLTSIGDYRRGHLNVRHLRSFRVKNHDVVANNYQGPRQVMGYKPLAELGATPHVNPPVVIDQPMSWAAVLFKMRYGEPVGDDVESLKRWNTTKIVNDADKSLYGAQFLGHSRTVTGAEYPIYARPSLAAAAWAVLAASDVRGVLAPEPPVRPNPAAIVLQSVPQPADGRFKLTVSWVLDEGHGATYYEVVVEKLDPSKKWVPVFPQATAGPLVRILEDSRYTVRLLIPAPPYSSSFRARVRVRNADAGEWGTSYSQSIPADRLAIRRFLDEDVLQQEETGGAAWTSDSPWRWLSPGS